MIWCPASKSEDAFVWMPNSDYVRCAECGRYLMLTKRLTLPRHGRPLSVYTEWMRCHWCGHPKPTPPSRKGSTVQHEQDPHGGPYGDMSWSP